MHDARNQIKLTNCDKKLEQKIWTYSTDTIVCKSSGWRKNS